MAQEFFQKIAYIGLRKTDGSILLNVPLYIKVSELNKNGVTQSQEELIHQITEVMLRRYEVQISEHFAKLKANKGKPTHEID